MNCVYFTMRFLVRLWSYLFGDTTIGNKAITKMTTLVLFGVVVYIEIYTIIHTDCKYSLEFVITNLSYISISLGLNVIGQLKTKEMQVKYTNGNGCHGNGGGNSSSVASGS